MNAELSGFRASLTPNPVSTATPPLAASPLNYYRRLALKLNPPYHLAYAVYAPLGAALGAARVLARSLIAVSVILPVRNGVPYIRSSVESILNQNFDEYELIVVDNQSTDSTIEVVRSFGDPRIRILYESRTGGPAAFNTGMRVASGQYIARMDADDVALPERLEIQSGYLDCRKDIQIVGSQAYKIDAHGRLIGKSIVPQHPRAIRQASRHAAPFVHPTLMFRREVWQRLGGYREFSPGADYDMLLRALDLGFRVANLPEFLLKYRILPDSVSHRRRQQTIIHSFAVKKMHRLRQKRRFSEEQAVLDRLQGPSIRQGVWFSTLDRYVYTLTGWRNRRSLSSGTDRPVLMANLLIAAISGLHPHMLRSLWSALRLKMIAARYGRPDAS